MGPSALALTFVLCGLCLVMPDSAPSVKECHLFWPWWPFCTLPPDRHLERKVVLSILMEIKSCRIENRRLSWRVAGLSGPMDSSRIRAEYEKALRPAIAVWRLASLHSFLIKGARFLTQARWFFGTLVHCLLGPLVWIRLVILAPAYRMVRSPGLCLAAGKPTWSLDLILLTIEEEPTWPSRGRTWTKLEKQ